ncbi:hypothetical protein BS17DRAFT_777894 [Gyrodon lividus]|nr:hypothetical protein BS17DRAFT_777894 [Gyrodon lividus]
MHFTSAHCTSLFAFALRPEHCQRENLSVDVSRSRDAHRPFPLPESVQKPKASLDLPDASRSAPERSHKLTCSAPTRASQPTLSLSALGLVLG